MCGSGAHRHVASEHGGVVMAVCELEEYCQNKLQLQLNAMASRHVVGENCVPFWFG